MWRKGKYRQPVAMLLGKKSDRRGLAPGREGTRCQIAVAFRDEALPDHLLDDQGQGRADVADDIRRATFLSGFEIRQVIVMRVIHEGDRSPARAMRARGPDGVAPDDHDPAGARP